MVRLAASIVLLLLTVLVGSCQYSQKEGKISPVEYAKKMADSDIKRNPEGWMIDFREKPKWEYTHGLMMNAHLALFEETGDKNYLRYVKGFADTMVMNSGEILTYKLSDYNIDRVSPGRFLINLYQIHPEPEYLKAIELLRSQMDNHPRTREGGF